MKEEDWPDRCERYFTSIAECEKNSQTKPQCGSSQVKQKLKPKYLPFKLRQWLVHMDLHSASYIGGTNSLATLIFWVCVCSAGVGALSYLISARVVHYMKSGSHFVFMSGDNSRFTPHLPLSVSLCNANILRKSTLKGSRFEGLLKLQNIQAASRVKPKLADDTRIKELHRTLGAEDMLVEESRHEYNLYRGMKTSSDWEMLYKNALDAEVSNLQHALRPTRQELRRHGVKLYEDLLQCWTDGKTCESRNLLYHSHVDNGNCLDVQLTKGFERLTLILNTRPEDYLGSMTSSPAFKVKVHSSSNQPQAVSDHHVSPGHSLKINLQKVSIFDALSCNAAPGYSQQKCERDCFERLSRDVCGCSVDIDAPISDRCQLHVQFDYICIRVLEKMKRSRSLPCDCDVDCRDIRVITAASSLPWPSEAHKDHLVKSLRRKGYNGSSSDIRKDLVHIEITANDVVYESYKEQEDMTVLALLIEVGALSALLCGISLLTILQILVGLFHVLLSLYSKIFNRKNEEKAGMERLQDGDVNTFTWSGKNTSQETGKKLQSSTTFLSTLTPAGHSLDPIKEMETPRTDDHTYEAISSRMTAKDQPDVPEVKVTAQNQNIWSACRGLPQWRSLEGPASGRKRWAKPGFSTGNTSGLENKVFYGSKDDIDGHTPRYIDDLRERERFNTLPSPRRTRWPDRPAIPPLNLTKMHNADGFWMGSNPGTNGNFKRTRSGSNVLTWSDFAKQYGVPKVENSDKTKSKNIFYM